MSNDNNSKIVNTSIRLPENIRDMFSELSKNFKNQGEALEYLVTLGNLEKVKANFPERTKEVESFMYMLHSLTNLFSQSFFITKEQEERFNKEFGDLKKELKVNEKKIVEISKSFEEMTTSKEHFEAISTQLQLDFQKEKELNNKNDILLTEKENNNLRLKDDIKNYKDDIKLLEDYKTKFFNKEKEVTEYFQKLHQAQLEIIEKKNQLEGKETKISVLEGNMTLYKENADTFKMDLQEIKKEKKEIDLELKEANGELSKTKERLSLLERENDSLKRDKEEFNKKLEIALKEIEELKKK